MNCKIRSPDRSARSAAYLLTGDPTLHRDLQQSAWRKSNRGWRTCSQAYAGSDLSLGSVRDLQVLIGKRLADLSMILAIQKTQGTAAAIALVKTSVGSDTGAVISDILDRLRDREGVEHREAAAHWESSLALSRWITLVGTIINMLLVGVATRLVYMDMRRRAALNAELRDQKLQARTRS